MFQDNFVAINEEKINNNYELKSIAGSEASEVGATPRIIVNYPFFFFLSPSSRQGNLPILYM